MIDHKSLSLDVITAKIACIKRITRTEDWGVEFEAKIETKLLLWWNFTFKFYSSTGDWIDIKNIKFHQTFAVVASKFQCHHYYAILLSLVLIKNQFCIQTRRRPQWNKRINFTKTQNRHSPTQRRIVWNRKSIFCQFFSPSDCFSDFFINLFGQLIRLPYSYDVRSFQFL